MPVKRCFETNESYIILTIACQVSENMRVRVKKEPKETRMKHAIPITCRRQIVPKAAETSLQTKLNFIVSLWESIGSGVLHVKYF